ncbi:MAG: energy-converting hydrogenase Eha subunit E [Cognaticolwellia sp.]|jgi:energy-converting hydrogenase Eha subunit E
MNKFTNSLIAFFLFLTATTFAQDATIRGVVRDDFSGDPVISASVYISGTTNGTSTNLDGFYSLNVEPGTYKVVCMYLGYDSTVAEVTVVANQVFNQPLILEESAVNLSIVDVSARKSEAKTEIKISSITLTPKQIKQIPATGGEADLAQYLQVLPGVVFTGDQGGQLYIRGGSPVQNRVMMDGMTIVNPFHSIGFFSVFETEIIKNVEVLTGGFNAEYGGRVSAIIDITTRDGNKKRLGGLVSVSPFQAKALIEGPIKKLDERGNSVSYIFTGKHSYINETSKTLYSYIDTAGLPFSYTDLYGKISFNGGNGSKLNLFGFNYTDRVNYSNIADLAWIAQGGGADFVLIPGASKMIIGGNFNYSNYDIEIQEGDDAPRRSSIGGFVAKLDFTYYGDNSEFKYGFNVTGNRTDFEFTNLYGNTINEVQNTTELAGFLKYRKSLDRLVIEPSVRFQYYASISERTIEPRLGIKFNASDRVRFKFAGGYYTQDLISAVNEQDIVNLFVGFISSPSDVAQPNSTEDAESRLQKSIHAIGGIEIDISDNIGLNIEPYYKAFPQLISLNRNKKDISEPNFITETGSARGIDFLLQYRSKDLFIWTAYSLGYVNRNDGEEEYSTHFDRRHNANFICSYKFGENDNWESSVRWNIGSGFPFTLTQGFYSSLPFENGIDTDIVSENPDLGVIYSVDRNTGRLPYYHRMDVSVKYIAEFSRTSKMEITASVTNVYNRENIFYFDRVEYERVNQLPIVPSLGVIYTF